MDKPKGISLLYALYHAPSHQITGSVKFNKIIAKLYTEGFKKDVPLALLPKGSAVHTETGSLVIGIKDCARLWENIGFLEIKETNTGKTNNRDDYQLTKSGIDYLRENYNELIENNGLITDEKARVLIQQIESLNSSSASEQEHKEFFFDLTLNQRKKILEELQIFLEKKYNIYNGYTIESVEFDIAGMTGIINGIIHKISDQVYKEKYSLWLENTEQYLAHFYILKHAKDYESLLENNLSYNLIEEKYLLIRHIALGSKVIHDSSSEEFEAKYFFQGGEIKSPINIS